jgi:SAM-dependent methyltransferase
MHDTALITGDAFAQNFGGPGKIVMDLGGQDVNGSLRKSFEKRGMKYICVDMVKHPSVDVVVQPGEKIPFEDGYFDLIVSTSCFEHDPMFWVTFKEMTRLVKLGGFIYVNAPKNGVYHGWPGDNWRFYSDAGQSLAFWASKQYGNESIYPVKVVETFHVLPLRDIWTDFVCIWERVNEKETSIISSNEIRTGVGVLQSAIRVVGVKTESFV